MSSSFKWKAAVMFDDVAEKEQMCMRLCFRVLTAIDGDLRKRNKKSGLPNYNQSGIVCYRRNAALTIVTRNFF